MRTLLILLLGATAHADALAARLHHEKATELWANGSLDDAADEYLYAFQEKPEAALLYDAAQAYRLSGNRARALPLYVEYLREFPKAPHRAAVRAVIAELKEARQEDAHVPETQPIVSLVSMEGKPDPAVAVAPMVVETRAAPVKKRRTWIWGVVAGSVAIVGGAVALGFTLGSHDHSAPQPTFGTAGGI